MMLYSTEVDYANKPVSKLFIFELLPERGFLRQNIAMYFCKNVLLNIPHLIDFLNNLHFFPSRFQFAGTAAGKPWRHAAAAT